MQAENDRIRRAQEAVDVIQKRIALVEKPVADIDTAMEKYGQQTKKLGDEAAESIVAAIGDASVSVTKKIGEQSGDILTRALGGVTRVNAEVGKKASDLYKKKVKTDSLEAVIARIRPDAPATPTPPTPPNP